SCPVSPPIASATVQRTHLVYDEEGRVTQQSEGFGSTEQYDTFFQYASTGELGSVCGPGSPSEQRCTDYHYNHDSQVEWLDRPDGRRDRFYSHSSGLVRLTRENSNLMAGASDLITRLAYDGNGRLKNESSCSSIEQPETTSSGCAVDEDQVRKQYFYDALGRITQVQLFIDTSDPNPVTGKRVYNYNYSPDGLTTTIKVVGAQQETILSHDALGNLLQVVEKNDSQTLEANYEYDGDGRLTKTTDPEGLVTTYTYDSLGRMLTRGDLSGTTSWTYNDTAGSVRISRGDGSYTDVSSDRLGRVSTIATSDGINFGYTYDALGRLDLESWSGTGGSGSRDYDYTLYGEIEKVTGPFAKVVDYRWDEMGRQIRVAFDSYQIETAYNGLDEVDQLTTPAGVFEFGFDDYTGALLRTTYPTGSGLKTIFTRNELGELTRLQTTKHSTTIADYQITLDGLGRRSEIASEQPMAPGFGSDPLQILLKSDGANSGLLDKINGLSATYDGRGNLVNLPAPYAASFSYDGLNRLTAASTTEHKYDAARNRLETLRSGETTRYLLDMSGALPDMLATTDDQNVVENVYIHGPGGLLAEVNKDGTTRFVAQDFNHNVVALTDSTGDVVSSYAYTPFGRNAGLSGDMDFPFRFAGGVGAMTDPEGVMYMRARYYHPGVQQFTSPDLVPGTLSRPQSLHRYAYVEGMGLGGVDPSGLETEKECVERRYKKTGKRLSPGGRKRVCRGFSRLSGKDLGELAIAAIDFGVSEYAAVNNYPVASTASSISGGAQVYIRVGGEALSEGNANITLGAKLTEFRDDLFMNSLQNKTKLEKLVDDFNKTK
ncbi:MAG: hypothetical protein GY703_04310, partial [Gammaproteobacteria bacterium]|nr:hypothetical protein [Gammaproteobacteria bacterium]